MTAERLTLLLGLDSGMKFLSRNYIRDVESKRTSQAQDLQCLYRPYAHLHAHMNMICVSKLTIGLILQFTPVTDRLLRSYVHQSVVFVGLLCMNLFIGLTLVMLWFLVAPSPGWGPRDRAPAKIVSAPAKITGLSCSIWVAVNFFFGYFGAFWYLKKSKKTKWQPCVPCMGGSRNFF